MQTREIPKSEWDDYLSLIGEHQHEHLVRVEVASESMGDQIITERAPLRALSVDLKDASPSIEISVGPTDAAELMHRIPSPIHLYVEEGDDGHIECIDIEDQTNARTLVEFLH